MTAILGALPAASAGGEPPSAHDETLALLPHLADEVMVRWNVPGMAVAVVRADEVVFAGGFGVTDLESGTPVDPGTVFGIGSVTKPVTAISAGVLVESGRLGWDRPVREVLPDLKLEDLYTSLKLTPRDLLSHRSGLARHDLVWYRSAADRTELLGRLAHLELQAGLRQEFAYNNLGYLILGAVADRLTGEPWETFVRTRLLGPIGMDETMFGPPSPGPEVRFARPHAGSGEEPVEVAAFKGGAANPAAGLYSSAEDLGRFLRMMLGRGSLDGERIISETTVVEVLTPQTAVRALGPRELPLTTYGLGWFVTVYRGHLWVWHSGSVDGYHAIAGLLPYDDLGVVVLTNRSEQQAPEVVSRWVMDRFLGLPEINWHEALTDQSRRLREVQHDAQIELESYARPDLPPTLPLEAYAGSYRHPGYGELEVRVAGERLEADLHGLVGTLRHVRGDVFLLELPTGGVVSNVVVGFEASEVDGATAAVSPLQHGLDPIVFRRSSAPGADSGTGEGQEPATERG